MTALKILAFDTTAKTATAALTENEKLIGISTLNTANTHSVTLLPMIDDILSRSGTDIKDVGLIVVSAGPGSFTGVRIGAATAKGLAFAHNTACLGVSSLEALAMNIWAEDGIVSAVMDARRGQLYNAVFEIKNGTLSRKTPDRAITAEELFDELKDVEKKIYLSGDGYNIAREALACLDVAEVPEDRRYQNAYNVAILGYRFFMRMTDEEKAECTAAKLSPVYLRTSSAERERLEKENKNK